MSSLLKDVEISIKSLIISSPKELTILELNRDYKNMEGRDIPFKQLGFRDLESFLVSIPGTLKLDGHGVYAIVRANNAGKVSHIQDMISKQKNSTGPKGHHNHYNVGSNARRPRRNVSTFSKRGPLSSSSHFMPKSNQINRRCSPTRRPISNLSADVSKNMPPTMNGQIYKREIPPISYNNNNLKPDKRSSICIPDKQQSQNLLAASRHSVESINLKLSKLNIVENKQPVINSIEKNSNSFKPVNDNEEAIPQDILHDAIFMSIDIPDNAFPLGIKIESAPITEQFAETKLLPLYITEIHSPIKFWFNIHDPNKKLEELMRKMQDVYNRSENKYSIANPAPNNYCVTKFNNLWHRAEILQNPISDKVKVFFIDYGTTLYVPLTTIKYLLYQFGELPAQAYRGALSHIKPTTKFWTKPAAEQFLSLTHEQLLYGKVSKINNQNSVTYMVICDTNGPKDVQFNKNLIENGFATFNLDWLSELTEREINSIYNVEFPNFDILEKGTYPSYEEISLLYDQGMQNYHLLELQNEFHMRLRKSPESIREFVKQNFIHRLLNIIENDEYFEWPVKNENTNNEVIKENGNVKSVNPFLSF